MFPKNVVIFLRAYNRRFVRSLFFPSPDFLATSGSSIQLPGDGLSGQKPSLLSSRLKACNLALTVQDLSFCCYLVNMKRFSKIS